ncbi:MAG: DUF6650 family protein [Chloroflexota bacterium]
MRIPWTDLKNRITLTGVSVPWAGLQWTLDQSEQEKARRLIIYLEDRRVLYYDYDYECPSHCVRSVQEIRQHLVEALQGARPGDQLATSLRHMTAACRRFQDDISGSRRSGYRRRYRPPSWDEDEGLENALGMLRGAFGFHLCLIAGAYRLDISNELAGILPALPDNDLL